MTFEELMNYQILKTEHLDVTVSSIGIVVIVIVATFIGLRIIRSFFNRFIKKSEAERRSYWSVYLILRYVVWVVVIVLLLETSGVKVSILAILHSITRCFFGCRNLFWWKIQKVISVLPSMMNFVKTGCKSHSRSAMFTSKQM